MSPDVLKSYLEVLKASGLQHAQLKLPDFELAVVFPLELVQTNDVAPAPGGWKDAVVSSGPTKLDRHYEIEELPPLVEQPYVHPGEDSMSREDSAS